MAVSVADVVGRYDGIDQDDLAEDLARRWAPDRGHGASTRDLLLALRAGGRWWVLAPAAHDGDGSFGAGASCRAAPIGAWWADDLEAVVEDAEASAETTHAHPEAAAGAIAVAVAVALAATSRGQDGPGASAFLADVAAHLPGGRVADGVETAAILGPLLAPAEAAERLGPGAGRAVFDVVPYALWCAARSLDDSTGAAGAPSTPPATTTRSPRSPARSSRARRPRRRPRRGGPPASRSHAGSRSPATGDGGPSAGREDGDVDDRLGRRAGAEGPVERDVTEGEDAAVLGDHQVPVAGRRLHDARHRLVERRAAHGAVERRVAEREDPAVGRHQPVALARRRGRHPHDRLVEAHRPGRPEEPGVAEREDPAVGRDQPVAGARRRHRRADDAVVQVHVAQAAVERGVTADLDAAGRREDPQALAGPRGGDRRVRVVAGRRGHRIAMASP